MVSSILSRAAVAAGLLASTVSAAFSATSNQNVVVYWGQGSNQIPLSKVCADPDVDIVNIAFIIGFPKFRGDLPKSDFANACGAAWYPNPDGTPSGLLSSCPGIGPGIDLCHANGKKVLLSLGGGWPRDYYLPSEDVAKYFAEFLWGAFGPVTSAWTNAGKPRPFGNSYVDGFDLDIESDANWKYYDTLVNHFKKVLYPQQPSGKFYISAAPQCPTQDVRLSAAIKASEFDFIFIQFYNTLYCNLRAGYNGIGKAKTEFTFDGWVSEVKAGASKNARIYLGMPAGIAGAPNDPTAFLSPTEANALVTFYKNKYPTYFGGVMLWEATVSDRNPIKGATYIAWIKQICTGKFTGENNPPKPSSSSISSTKTSSSLSSTKTSTISLTSTKTSSSVSSTKASSSVSSTKTSSSVSSTKTSSSVSSTKTSSSVSSIKTSSSSSSTKTSSSLSSSKASSSSSSTNVYSVTSLTSSSVSATKTSSSSSSSDVYSVTTLSSSSSSAASSTSSSVSPSASSTQSSSSSDVYSVTSPSSSSSVAPSTSSSVSPSASSVQSSSSSDVYSVTTLSSSSSSAAPSTSASVSSSALSTQSSSSSDVYSVTSPSSSSSAASSTSSSVSPSASSVQSSSSSDVYSVTTLSSSSSSAAPSTSATVSSSASSIQSSSSSSASATEGSSSSSAPASSSASSSSASASVTESSSSSSSSASVTESLSSSSASASVTESSSSSSSSASASVTESSSSSATPSATVSSISSLDSSSSASSTPYPTGTSTGDKHDTTTPCTTSTGSNGYPTSSSSQGYDVSSPSTPAGTASSSSSQKYPEQPASSSSSGKGYPPLPTVTPKPTSSGSYPVDDKTVTVITTTYVDACPTGLTTITTTVTKTVCNKCTKPTDKPGDVPEGWTTSVYVCTKCGPKTTTVTLTKPVEPTEYPVHGQAQPSDVPEAYEEDVTSVVEQYVTLTKVAVPYTPAPQKQANNTGAYVPSSTGSGGAYPTKYAPPEFEGAASRAGVGLTAVVVLMAGVLAL